MIEPLIDTRFVNRARDSRGHAIFVFDVIIGDTVHEEAVMLHFGHPKVGEFYFSETTHFDPELETRINRRVSEAWAEWEAAGAFGS